MNIIQCKANEFRLFTTDQHIGSPEIDYKLISEELSRADSYNADVFIGGDLFDSIVPKDGKKFKPSVLHKRLWGKNDVIGEQIDWAVGIYRPVARLIRAVGKGNHDEWIEKFHGFNPIKEFLKRLGILDTYIGYSGYIKYPDTTIYFHHGTGSGTSMAGALGAMESRAKFIDADVIWMGHKHHRLFGHLRRLKPGNRKSRRYRDTRFIMSGSYMDTYNGFDESYGEERSYPPQGKGGVWYREGSYAYD